MKQDHLLNFQAIRRGKIPSMDFHLHTAWTDGAHSVAQMHESALRQGLQTILFSEHARKTSMDWFPKFVQEVRSLPNSKCRALVGVEVKVENLDGTLDTTSEILNQCDVVMASVHRFPGEKGNVQGFDEVLREKAPDLEFQLACAILKNPAVDILAHPFGMCYRRFDTPPTEALIKKLIAETAKTKIAFEINPHYHPKPWLLIRWCQEAGARISLGSNAHNIEEVGRVNRLLKETSHE